MKIPKKLKIALIAIAIPVAAAIAVALTAPVALLTWVMGSKRPGLLPDDPVQPSLLEELWARGYDLSTLEFSIKKRIEP